ncbi:hypothetical protein BDF14DRAFT_1748228 [Spinellus fusiger]|nr:hypothetical protein BDF14DRAFT_1748228 [Spinellus fusiger]
MAHASTPSQSSLVWRRHNTLSRGESLRSSQPSEFSYTPHTLPKTTAATPGTPLKTPLEMNRTSTDTYAALAHQYQTTLFNSLSELHTKETEKGPPQQRSGARQKLSRLNTLQFHELATDVYDECKRRTDYTTGTRVPFLPVCNDFHPRRNQARQKLATLPELRFKDLCSDIYWGLEKRYPQSNNTHVSTDHPTLSPETPEKEKTSQDHLTEAYTYPRGSSRSQQETLHINRPVSSTTQANEALEQRPGQGSRQRPDSGNFQSLDSLMADLDTMVGTVRLGASFSPLPPLPSLPPLPTSQTVAHTSDPHAQSDTKNMVMRKETSTDPSEESKYNELRRSYDQLHQQYKHMEEEYTTQKETVRQVKRETHQLMDYFKNLSVQTQTLNDDKQRLEEQIRHLKEQVKTWQAKYEAIQHSVGPQVLDLTSAMAQDSPLQPNPQGAIRYEYFIEYQTAVNCLLSTARSVDPASMLLAMKTLVAACHHLSQDTEAHEHSQHFSHALQPRLSSIKANVSNALSHLLTVAKGHAVSGGLSPVSLLDAAVGQLTQAVVAMVQLVGLSDQSLSHSPSSDGLNEYLKRQTELIVHTIQTMLGALRSGQTNQVQHTVQSLGSIVSDILSTCAPLHKTAHVLASMEISKKRLLQRSADSFTSIEKVDSEAKRELAKEAYEIAKYTKELLTLVEE